MWQTDLKTRMEVDILAFATGGVILQKQVSDGLHHPIAFCLESLSELEHNYEIYNRKLLAIVQGLEEWRHYLIGLPEPFTIATDHRNLEYWTKASICCHSTLCIGREAEARRLDPTSQPERCRSPGRT
jgi:hypothetical protein